MKVINKDREFVLTEREAQLVYALLGVTDSYEECNTELNREYQDLYDALESAEVVGSLNYGSIDISMQNVTWSED